VIDDAPENVRFVGRILKPLANVTFALGGVDGVTRALSQRPDLILLDVEMPDMSGYDVIERLQSDPAVRETPVIFLTGRSDGDAETRGLELGAIDYVTKPFNPTAVLARVRNHLRLLEYGRKLRALNEELERRATTDELTGLPNRRAFFEFGARELTRFARYGEPAAVILLDIDHFKRVNDTFGHDAGDIVLREVARRLTRTTRQLDWPARLGGEEFAVLLPKAAESGAETAARRILEALRAAPVETPAGPIPVTATAGVTQIRAGDGSLEAVLKRADLALYEGKRAGRDRFVVSTPQSAAAREAGPTLRVVS
jgi:diguanylate cyclase (GGDEF)-like protein